ncbi:N-acetyltransferase 8-like [Gastrophryne carolinensis]
MSGFSIRLYQDSDYVVVRDIFARGIKEHTNTAFYHSLSLLHVQAILLVIVLLLPQTTGSYILSIGALSLSLAALWLMNRHVYSSYVEQSLADDMLDIRKYYLERDGYCFWVAESAGEIVGMIAAVPLYPPTGDNQVELKRLSVPIKHRGRGIAKALCKVVIDYARNRGSRTVVLTTSLSQKDACSLYEKLGFRRTMSAYFPFVLARFIGMRILYYKYDILLNI